MTLRASTDCTLSDARSRSLRTRILGSLGLATLIAQAACGEDASSTGPGGAGGVGNGSASSTVSTGSKSGASGTSTSTSQATGSATTSASTGTGGMQNVERCFANTAVPAPACPAPDVAAAMFGNCTSTAELVTIWVSGPTVKTDACCYQVDVTDPNNGACGVVGRPLMIEDVPRSAHLSDRASDWLGRGSIPDLRGLDEATRLALANAWSSEAAFEHASVASFAKLSLELMALGAPRELIEATHRAALDELEHASLGFSLATAYAGSERGPGLFEVVRDLRLATSLADLAAQAVEEGCVGETLAALIAGAQRHAASDDAVVSALSRIAEDEARHAELSWRIVGWALAVGDAEVGARVENAFARAIEQTRQDVETGRLAKAYDVEDESVLRMRAHGRLAPIDVANEKDRGLREVVLPAMRALLAGRPS